MPDAALRPEPELPAPPASAWPFGETWSRTSGTGRLGGGAATWSDFLYDDHGAAVPGGLPLSQSAMTSNLAPTQGTYGYTDPRAAGNGADVFRSAVGADGAASYWRVDWTTLVDPAVPLAVWGIDLDDAAATGAAVWPAAAGVTSPGQDRFLVVSSRGAQLLGGAAPVSLPVSVDLPSRSFTVRVPRSVMALPATSRVRLVSGLSDASGTGLAPPQDTGAGALSPSLPRVYDVAYDAVAQEPPVYDTDPATTSLLLAGLGSLLTTGPLATVGLDGQTRFVTGNFWMEDHQADDLLAGSVAAFSSQVVWGDLAARRATPEPRPTGYSNRWYVSSLDLEDTLGPGVVRDGDGSPAPTGDLEPNYRARVQPYAVQVPAGVGEGAPLTWVLHSLGVNMNQYGALDPTFLQQLCDGRGSICASTLGHGPDGWYFDEAEADFWQVWREVAQAYAPSTEETVISGYSMGGWAAYKLGLAHPDLFARALSLEGPPTCGIAVAEGFVRLPADASNPVPGRCGADGRSKPLLANARWVPYGVDQGAVDQLVPVTSGVEQVAALDALGQRYHFEFYPTEDHLLFAIQDRFGSQVAALGGTPSRVVDPGHITYGWYPDVDDPALGIGTTTAYWLSGLQARSATGEVSTAAAQPGAIASVDAVSRAVPDPAVTVSRTQAPLTEPTPGVAQDLVWTLGDRPAAAQRLELTLTDVGALTVDAVRAGLGCGAVVATTSDGPATLTMTGLPAGARLSSTAVPEGTGTATVLCASATGGTGTGTGGTGTGGGTTTAAPATGTLPRTGGGAATGLVALALLGGAGVLRRRRA